jgi:hypothetical protein
MKTRGDCAICQRPTQAPYQHCSTSLQLQSNFKKRPSYMNRRGSNSGRGHFFFETKFRPAGEMLDAQLVPEGADDIAVASQLATLLNTPMATTDYQSNIRHKTLQYQYSKYQSHAGMEWRMCICVRISDLDNYCHPDVSVALEYGGPTGDETSRASADISQVKTRVWFSCTYSQESMPKSNRTLKTMDHTFDHRFPAAWTEVMCLSCPWSISSAYCFHAD